MTTFKKFTSIEKFSDAAIMAQRQMRPSIFYRTKVKLHGTNAGVKITPDGEVTFQKRTDNITPGSDNAGFAAWASTKPWAENFKKIDRVANIWGEWAGPGVQKGDAISSIDRKRFFIFGIEVFNVDGNNDTDSYMIACPDMIGEYIGEMRNDTDVVILPWNDEPHKVKFFGDEDAVTSHEYAEYLNSLIEKMEVRDDFVYINYGVDMPGEGYVAYPFENENDKIIERSMFGSYVFKVKTEAHTSAKTKGAKVAVVIPASVIDFANDFVTEARMEQMVREHCDNEYSMKRIPDFLRALVADIEKESVNERENGNITMKDASKPINQKALAWFKSKVDLL